MSTHVRARRWPVVDAWQWDETQELLEILEARGMRVMGHSGHAARPNECTNLRIYSKDESRYVSRGDWIIREPDGRFGVCGASIFALTYEVLDSDSAEPKP